MEGLYRTQTKATDGQQEKAQGCLPAIFGTQNAKQGVQKDGDCRVINVLRLSGEDLHRDGDDAPKDPFSFTVFNDPVHAEKNQGNPDHGPKVSQVSRINVHEKRAGKHEQDGGQQGGDRAQPPVSHPEEHETADQEDVQRNTGVDGDGQRQYEEHHVGQIECDGNERGAGK